MVYPNLCDHISMVYTVSQLAKQAGVTPRTLRYYDKVGLLHPSHIGENGYRYYESSDLIRLQHILFYRELDFSIKDIRRILNDPQFDSRRALQEQKRILEARGRRIKMLIKTINNTIHSMNTKQTISDEDLYEGFSKEEIEEIKREAKERWGHSSEYMQSMQRTKAFAKEDWKKIKEETERNMTALAKLMDDGEEADSSSVQAEIKKHFEGINQFYDCSKEVYLGLANMYVSDERFKAHYEAYRPGLAEFLSNGMKHFVKSL